MDDVIASHEPIKYTDVRSNWSKLPSAFDKRPLTAYCNQIKELTIEGPRNPECGLAQPNCLVQHRVKHRREIARRRVDDAQDLSGRGLLFQCFARLSHQTRVLSLQRRAASLVDKILKGANPADLPVEQAERFALTIIMKTAKALDN